MKKVLFQLVFLFVVLGAVTAVLWHSKYRTESSVSQEAQPPISKKQLDISGASHIQASTASSAISSSTASSETSTVDSGRLEKAFQEATKNYEGALHTYKEMLPHGMSAESSVLEFDAALKALVHAAFEKEGTFAKARETLGSYVRWEKPRQKLSSTNGGENAPPGVSPEILPDSVTNELPIVYYLDGNEASGEQATVMLNCLVTNSGHYVYLQTAPYGAVRLDGKLIFSENMTSSDPTLWYVGTQQTVQLVDAIEAGGKVPVFIFVLEPWVGSASVDTGIFAFNEKKEQWAFSTSCGESDPDVRSWEYDAQAHKLMIYKENTSENYVGDMVEYAKRVTQKLARRGYL